MTKDQPERAEKLPAQQVTQPGYVYENPNEDQVYVPPEDETDQHDDGEDERPR